MKPVNKINKGIKEGDKIEVSSVAVFLWKKKRTLLQSILTFIVLGFIVALGSPEEFTSKVRIIPESSQAQSLSNLSSIVKQFGLQTNAGSPSEGIPTIIYPDLAKNLVVMDMLLDYKIKLPDSGEEVTLFEYFKDHQKTTLVGFFQKNVIRFPLVVKGWISKLINRGKQDSFSAFGEEAQNRRIYNFTKAEWEIIEQLQRRVSAELDRNYIVITVSVKMPDPYIAADVADQLVESFTTYITEYRTQKARSDLRFVEERYQESMSRFEEAQQDLAKFQDRNRSTMRAIDEIELQRLQSQYNLTFNVYNSLAEQLEQAKIRVQEETPVVGILEPAAVPDNRSEPKRTRLLISYTMFGFLLGVVWIYGKKFYDENKTRIESV